LTLVWILDVCIVIFWYIYFIPQFFLRHQTMDKVQKYNSFYITLHFHAMQITLYKRYNLQLTVCLPYEIRIITKINKTVSYQPFRMNFMYRLQSDHVRLSQYTEYVYETIWRIVACSLCWIISYLFLRKLEKESNPYSLYEMDTLASYLSGLNTLSVLKLHQNISKMKSRLSSVKVSAVAQAV
jgi:hypothetical protein